MNLEAIERSDNLRLPRAHAARVIAAQRSKNLRDE